MNPMTQYNLSSNCYIFKNCKNDKDQTYKKYQIKLENLKNR